MKFIWDEIEELLLERKRVIASLCGVERGPAVVFCGGIHGNEPTGVLALKNVFTKIAEENIPIRGSVLALIGNRNALHHKIRFKYTDLNRLWTPENINKLHSSGFNPDNIHPEILEMIELDNLLEDFIHENTESDRYFIDLHTTSSHSIPFALIDKSEPSYNLALKFPLPFIQNFDKHIKGTLINYLDHKNFSALVFEAGQHLELKAIVRHEAVVWITLVMLGIIDKKHVANLNSKYNLLSGISDDPNKVFEITYRHQVKPNDGFKMNEGFVNFQKIEKGELMAIDKTGDIKAPNSGRIFMPLYQKVGADGFFIIERVSKKGN